MLGDDVLLLGIIISILFFVLGINSFKNDDDWFEGTFYFLISAMSTCLMSVMLLTHGVGYVTPKGCFAIAIVGLAIGFVSSVRMVVTFTIENLMDKILKSSICLIFFIIYLYMSGGVLLLFDGMFENINVFELSKGIGNCISVLILLHFIHIAFGAIYNILSNEDRQFVATKIRSVLRLKKKNCDKKDHIKFIDFKGELKKRKEGKN